MLCEESNKKNPKNDIKNENLIKSIAQELINKLSTSPNLDQAFSDVLTAFKFYEGFVIFDFFKNFPLFLL